MNRTLAVVGAAAVAAVALAAGCGGGGGDTTTSASPTVEWANRLCSATTTWTNALKDSASAIKSGPYTQDALSAAADKARTATQTYLAALEDLGRPDVQAGTDAQAEVDKLRTQLQTGADTMKSATEGVSGAGDVLNAVSVVTGTLATMGSQVSTTVSNLKQLDAQGELQQAISQAQSCAALEA